MRHRGPSFRSFATAATSVMTGPHTWRTDQSVVAPGAT
jgi:hypothetical protein